MKNTKLTREQLYELVWSEPLLRLSKKYCISDNGLRKMCKSMNIPLPPNGYWMKIKYGKKVMKPKLPKQNTGKQEVVLRPRTENCNEQSAAKSALNVLVKEIMNDKSLVLEVPDRLSSRPDPLITSTKKYREAIKRHDWRRGGRYPERIDVLSIDVSDASLPRAYRLMDTIIKLLRSRKHDVKVNYRNSVTVIQGEEIEFRLREKNKVVKQGDGYGSRELIPTGNFIFNIGRWHEKYVSDGKQRLEDKIAVIIVKLELEGKREHEERIRREILRKEREEKERIEREIKESKEAELKRFTDIFKEAIQLHHATILRNYIDQLHSNSSVEKDWIEWARNKIDWYDPLVNTSDRLLDDNYKKIAFNLFQSMGKEE